ncbi:13999_t:CDS:2 [Cetraspora pellucida]|uniref:13999_t:CDS:1 n=1 Tax=Cetraspora pellucida TaxID=1433469 RepID=A0A9N9DYW1_9GLOM|nr:13999_t:CDS:2 [Cetraspora pellucida]
MTPVEAIQKKQVNAMSSLLYNSELEGRKHHVTDCNWSSQVYYICESLVQKNQPILYWLEDNEDNSPKRSFVREELQVIKDVQLPS